jgi:hypothetical protein
MTSAINVTKEREMNKTSDERAEKMEPRIWVSYDPASPSPDGDFSCMIFMESTFDGEHTQQQFTALGQLTGAAADYVQGLRIDNEKQRAAMVKAKEALEFYRDFSFADGGNKATKALAAFKSVGV